MGGGAAKFEGSLGSDRLDVCDTPDTVCAKNLRRLVHRPSETLGCQFVNGKVLIGLVAPIGPRLTPKTTSEGSS